jgi:hypothetical protein
MRPILRFGVGERLTRLQGIVIMEEDGTSTALHMLDATPLIDGTFALPLPPPPQQQAEPVEEDRKISVCIPPCPCPAHPPLASAFAETGGLADIADIADIMMANEEGEEPWGSFEPPFQPPSAPFVRTVSHDAPAPTSTSTSTSTEDDEEEFEKHMDMLREALAGPTVAPTSTSTSASTSMPMAAMAASKSASSSRCSSLLSLSGLCGEDGEFEMHMDVLREALSAGGLDSSLHGGKRGWERSNSCEVR